MSLDWRADLEEWAASRNEATTAEALSFLGYSEQRHLEMRAAAALRALGFTRRRYRRVAGARAYVYQRPDQVATVATHGTRRATSLPVATRSPPTSDPEWRRLRAELGGKTRALKEVQGQRDVARERAKTLEREKYSKSRLEVDPEVVALRAELGHAADCGHPDCARCRAATQRLEETRPRYATEDEIAEAIEMAATVLRAGSALLSSMRAQGVGAAERRLQAQRAFAALVEGSLKGAETLLSALGG